MSFLKGPPLARVGAAASGTSSPLSGASTPPPSSSQQHSPAQSTTPSHGPDHQSPHTTTPQQQQHSSNPVQYNQQVPYSSGAPHNGTATPPMHLQGGYANIAGGGGGGYATPPTYNAASYGTPPPMVSATSTPPPMATAYAPPPAALQSTTLAHNPFIQNQRGVGGASYQGVVAGLNGWNDPPNLIGVSKGSKTDLIGGGGNAPSGCGDASGVGKAVMGALDAVKLAFASDTSQRRIIDDTDRRLEELLERLGTSSIPAPVMAQLYVLAEGFNSRDIAKAQSASLQMTLLSTAHSTESRWILGVKRLVELFARIV